MKRLLAALLLFVILLSALAPVLATPNYESDGEVLKSLGVLTGNDDGDLMINANLNRQDMVVMISRLYKEENKAKSYIGKNIFKDLNADRKFYIPYITWAKDQGLIQGQDKDVFGFNANTTVQEFQTVLLRALGYGEEAQNWDNVPELAKKLGIMNDLELKASSKLTRGQMASMVLNTLRETKKGSLLTLAEVIGVEIPSVFKVSENFTVNKNSILVTGQATGTQTLKLHIRPTSSGISGGAKIVDLVMDKDGRFSREIKDLQAGSYEYRFEGDRKNTTFKSFTIDEIEFALANIVADNLKEISLLFTQPVDTSAASFTSNYTTTAGAIKNVRFEDNNKKLILVLNGTMGQQNKYKINAKVKGIDGQNIDISNHEFTTLDTTIPTVLDIVQLGKKGLKIVFSEPVKGANASNFKIDNKSFSGSVNVNNNEVILTYYSSQYFLSEGNHTLSMTGVVDFADYPAIIDNRVFTIVNDTTAPEIIGASASLEEVIVEFNEDVDPSTANKNQFYIKIGNTKRYPDSVKFLGNKAYISYRNNLLSLSETTIYAENVADYSGNKMRLSSVNVTPVIDKTSPEIVNYSVAEDGKSIDIVYSKNVQGKNRTNYSIKDQSGKVVYIRDIQGNDREFTIYLSNILPVGTNTLTIQGVQDTTPLKNILVNFEAIIEMKDISKPEVINYSGYGSYIMIHFNKEMDYTSVTNPNNYYMNFNGSLNYIPYDSLITQSNDNKSVTILLPETISGKKVVVGQNLSFLELRGIKDMSGNDIKGLIAKLTFDSSSSGKAKAVDYYPNIPQKQGVLVDDNTVKIRFNIPIIQAEPRDFSIDGRTIESVDVNGTNEVILYLNPKDSTSITDGKLTIQTNNNMKSYIETGVEGGVAINLVDEVAPRIKYSTNTLLTYNNTIELPFTEELEAEGASLYRRDLEIYREEDGQLLSSDDYSTSLKSGDKSILLITIKNRSKSSYYSIRVVGENGESISYIRDLQGNLANESGASYRTDSMINK